MVTFSELGKLGRMGNSMFQIAATIGYARQFNMPYVIPMWEHSKHFRQGFNESDNVQPASKYSETSFNYTKIPKYNNVDLYGYFQSKKYWQHCENEIRKLFAPNEAIQKILDRTPITGNSCAVHVRRGDYLSLEDYHKTLPFEYYKTAMEKTGADSYTFFSDDIDWCKKHFKGENIGYQASGNDLLDWFIMREHKNFIIANSSYSWWGSYLGNQEGKRVIAPTKDKWFGIKYKDNNVDDLYLENWELL